MNGVPRARLRYAAVAVLIILAGLMVHLHGLGMGSTARDITGDALWAMMIFCLASVAKPTSPTWQRCLAAALVCATVETSQLGHSPAVDTIRATTIGHLVLGSGFDPRDFASYGAGILLAGILDRR